MTVTCALLSYFSSMVDVHRREILFALCEKVSSGQEGQTSKEIPYYLAQVDQNLFEHPRVQVQVLLSKGWGGGIR